MRPTFRACLVALLVAGLVACRDSTTAPTPDGPSLQRATPGASFDWSVPARFGPDRDGDGLRDYFRLAAEINPASWPVNFDACALAPAAQYVWYVDDAQVASVTSCTYTHHFPTEGVYDVALHVIRVPGPGLWAEEVVIVQDWLVVSFGDSYASGEGVPEVTQGVEAVLKNINTSLQQLTTAQQLLADALTNLQDAFARKGLADAVLSDAQQERTNFFNACNNIDFKSIQACVDFLIGLPFSTYDAAKAHFDQAVQNAQDRVNSLTIAWQQAQAAHSAAQSSVNNLILAINALKAGLPPPKWQDPYPLEKWNNENCHRSANAAPARAALALEESDPRTSVTFVHLACTGARVDRFRASLREQIPWADTLTASREIDVVLVSIGGNDAGFVNLAVACVVQQPCYVDTPAFNPGAAAAYCNLLDLFGLSQLCNNLFGVVPAQSAKAILLTGVSALPALYDEVAGVLLPTLTGLLEPEPSPGAPGPVLTLVDRVRSDRVYITEYVDMTKDDAGEYCVASASNLLGTIPGITPDELQWLDRAAADSINAAGRAAAQIHGWNAVSGIYSGYENHGYCANTHWVVRAHETFLRQGDESGMAHPNLLGHTHNGQAIFGALLGDLYPAGLGAGPRLPNPAGLPAP